MKKEKKKTQKEHYNERRKKQKIEKGKLIDKLSKVKIEDLE